VYNEAGRQWAKILMYSKPWACLVVEKIGPWHAYPATTERYQIVRHGISNEAVLSRSLEVRGTILSNVENSHVQATSCDPCRRTWCSGSLLETAVPTSGAAHSGFNPPVSEK